MWRAVYFAASMRKRSLNVALALGVTLVALALTTPVLAKSAKEKPAPAPPPGPDPAEVIDATTLRDKLIVVTDGKGHYLAAPPDLADDSLRGTLFYSADGGKTFYAQRIPGYGSSG